MMMLYFFSISKNIHNNTINLAYYNDSKVSGFYSHFCITIVYYLIYY